MVALLSTGAPARPAQADTRRWARWSSASTGDASVGSAAALADRGLRAVDSTPGTGDVLAVALRHDVPVAVGGAIEDIDPVVTFRAMGVPNDPGYDFQWHLPAIDAASAWDVTTGAGAVVAVLDGWPRQS